MTDVTVSRQGQIEIVMYDRGCRSKRVFEALSVVCRVPSPSGWLMATCLSRMVDRVLDMRRTHGLLIDACHARWNLVSNGYDWG